MHYRLSNQALDSLEAIGVYTEDVWGIKQRDTYLEALDAAFTALTRFPRKGAGRSELGAGLRSCQEGAHIIFYRIEADEILIIDILHRSADVMARSESWT